MKCSNDKIIIINSREEWTELMKLVQYPDVIEVYIDNEHVLHNFIYFIILAKNHKNIVLNVTYDEQLNFNDVFFEMGALFYLVDKNIKKRVLVKHRDKFITIPSNYKDPQKLKFNKTLPFMLISKENLDDISKSFCEEFEFENEEIKFDKNEILALQHSNNAASFMKYFIKYIINFDDTLESSKKYIMKCTKELNLLSLFIVSYYLHPLNLSFDQMEDIKRQIRNYSIGLYQIIENSCFHSIGEYGLFFLSRIDLKMNQSSNSLKKLAERKMQLTQKRLSFIENYHFDMSNNEYIFSMCLDNAKDNEGKVISILDKYNKDVNANYDNLKDFFVDLVEVNDEKLISSKYGIRTFVNSALTLGMDVMINSGIHSIGIDSNGLISTKKNKVFKDYFCANETNFNHIVTEYSCCLPMKAIKRDIVSENDYLSRELLVDVDKYTEISLDDVFNTTIKHSDKYTDKQNFKQNLVTAYSKELVQIIKKNNQKIIFTLNYDFEKIKGEILVKTIANGIYESLKSKKKFYLVINFVDDKNNLLYFKLSEFFDYISICYSKLSVIFKSEEIKNQSNIQIAIYHSYKGKKQYISTIVGTKYNVAVQSFINNLLYNNVCDSLNKFDLYIDNLFLDNKKTNNEIKVFPFEIKMGNSEKIEFIENVNSILTEEMSHENLKVLLGSGLHLDKFYDAYSLFQNNYFAKRIAFLIYNDLNDLLSNINKIKDKKMKIVLVGYAAYSHMICEEIKKMIALNFNCQILYISNIGDLCVEDDKNHISMEDSFFISILPIGSTLNTFFKMNMALASFLRISDINRYVFQKNYCIISVHDEGDNKYWKKCELKNNIIKKIEFLQNNKRSIDASIIFELKTNWRKNDIVAISHVDKTSTLPNTIFKCIEKKSKIKNHQKEFEKIKYLINHVKYGHFSSKGNHHLFYIDYKSILKSNQLRNDLSNHFKVLREKIIDPLAYNIIVSPLSSSNEEFLRIIIDDFFQNNLSLIQFDLATMYRDNFVNKYKYIKDRINNILIKSSNSKVNIYFVDNTLVSGKSFKRAKELMNALLEETNYRDRFPLRIFKNAILFINRLSDNTLKTLMENNDNVHYYMNLNCPCFDTSLGTCPDCKITSNYNKLEFLTIDSKQKELFKISASKHSVVPIDKIRKNDYDIFDFIRLYFTHFVLENKEELMKKYNNSRKSNNESFEILSEIFKSSLSILKTSDELKEVSEVKYKEIFAKVISRPFITLYEDLKQLALQYLIKEFKELKDKFLNNEHKKDEIDYLKIIIPRISYFGSMFLKNDGFSSLYENEELKKILDKSLLWEEAYFRGVIK